MARAPVTDRTTVASVDARMREVEGSTPPAAEVIIELGTETFALPTKVSRVLLERLADSLISAEHYEQGEQYRRVLLRQQAQRVTRFRSQGEPA